MDGQLNPQDPDRHGPPAGSGLATAGTAGTAGTAATADPVRVADCYRSLAHKLTRMADRLDAVDDSNKNPATMVRNAFRTHEAGLELLDLSYKLKVWGMTNEQEALARPPIELLQLHQRVAKLVALQRADTSWKTYYHGYPYQGMALGNVFGARETERRYYQYGLDELISAEDRVLDIGSSCGFLSVLSALRRGCEADCIDHNKYMIAIGHAVAEFLRIDSRMRFFADDFQRWQADRNYTVLFSFAAHWTDDEGLRPDLHAHLRRLHGLLASGGRLLFETHPHDVGNANTAMTLAAVKGQLFGWDEPRRFDGNQREFYVMKAL